ncbi:hypothetical protein ERO13_D11G325151v2 [Gossypium hirsutum]|uniref:Non-specific lipid-transfer protein 14 n=1 Tax=Gossypium hirsutum TaxID=3635 RepID=A0ABM3B202_GOSHI|nr:putative non-specific lipid-transfer protein 14 [Gossypium hirsutum]KAG4123416.1 hypothetical protein ERO13_D11G325151v2 [Gossypium hirsutum]
MATSIGGSAVECTTVRELISFCATFISNGSPDPYPGTPCCEAVTNLYMMTHSTDNRRSLCGCLMGLVTANNSNSTAIATLPGFVVSRSVSPSALIPTATSFRDDEYTKWWQCGVERRRFALTIQQFHMNFLFKI